jgi:murein DD-endopeptidase MepM/ murein hydrolase activator NlpD
VRDKLRNRRWRQAIVTHLQRPVERLRSRQDDLWHDPDSDRAGIGVVRHRLRTWPNRQRQQELLVALIALITVGLGTATAGAVAAQGPARPAARATEETVDMSDRGDASDRPDRSGRQEPGSQGAQSQQPTTPPESTEPPATAPPESEGREDPPQPSQQEQAPPESEGREDPPQPSQQERAPAPAWVHPMPGASTTSCFGYRWGVQHAGVDLAAPPGTPIRTVGAGTVSTAGWAFPGYGISVVIDHGDGYYTLYAHAAEATVSVGEPVEPGDVIALEGSTGDSTGPHLHFEVHKGMWNQVEPTQWLRNRDVSVGGC